TRGAAARACSSIRSFNCRSRSTPRPTGPGPSVPSTGSCSIPWTASSRDSSTSRGRAFWSAATARSTFSIWRPVHITRADLYELTLPLVEPFVISGGAITERRSLIVVLHDDADHVGYGECPPFE